LINREKTHAPPTKFPLGPFFVDILGDTLWKLLKHPFFAALNFFGDLDNSVILETNF
jgi:hypothetical protein